MNIYKASSIEDEYGKLCQGLMYYRGIKSEKDFDKARDVFESLREQGNRYGPYYLALMYYNGYGVNVDSVKAFSLLEEASSLGSELADHHLAYIYFKGDFVLKDYNKGREFALRSAGTIASSAYLLGLSYERGLGVSVDKEKAKKWYQQAIDMGDEKAKKRLLILQ
jgi:hypothetical protein